MSYQVYLFPTETRERYASSGADFLASETLPELSADQRQSLETLLSLVGFAACGVDEAGGHYEQSAIAAQALLTASGLYLSASGQDGIFEISMWASEWAGSSALAKFDPQAGVWE